MGATVTGISNMTVVTGSASGIDRPRNGRGRDGLWDWRRVCSVRSLCRALEFRPDLRLRDLRRGPFVVAVNPVRPTVAWDWTWISCTVRGPPVGFGGVGRLVERVAWLRWRDGYVDWLFPATLTGLSAVAVRIGVTVWWSELARSRVCRRGDRDREGGVGDLDQSALFRRVAKRRYLSSMFEVDGLCCTVTQRFLRRSSCVR